MVEERMLFCFCFYSLVAYPSATFQWIWLVEENISGLCQFLRWIRIPEVRSSNVYFSKTFWLSLCDLKFVVEHIMLYSRELQKGWKIEEPVLNCETPASFLSLSHSKSAGFQAYVSPLFFPLFIINTFAIRVGIKRLLLRKQWFYCKLKKILVYYLFIGCISLWCMASLLLYGALQDKVENNFPRKYNKNTKKWSTGKKIRKSDGRHISPALPLPPKAGLLISKH